MLNKPTAPLPELVGTGIDSDELVRKLKGRKDPLFESQQVAPAPGQTYYQILVYPEEVILRDWPKKRMSTLAPTPGQKALTRKEFLDGELHDQILNIFGEQVLEICIRVSKSQKK